MIANVLVNTKDMPRNEWLAWRRKGIGGRPLEAPIELESGKCLNCLDVLSYYRGK